MPDETFELRLVDSESPDGTLWHFDPKTPKLRVHPLFPDHEWGGGQVSFPIPASGRVQLTPEFIGIGGGPILLEVEGYGVQTVELDYSKEGQTVELERDPTVEVTVVATGPGVARSERVDIMVSALPPVEPWEYWALFGPIGSRALEGLDCGLFDYLTEGAALGQSVTMPRPDATHVWVYVQLQAPSGYEPAESIPFGPFEIGQESIHCEFEAEEWVVSGATKEEGDAAGLLDRRECEVRLRVVSLATGEPIQGAFLKRRLLGKYRNEGNGSGADGHLVGRILGDEDDARIDHPLFAELRLGPLASQPGGFIDLGDVGLEPLRAIRGQLVDPSGQPLQVERRLQWTDSDGNERLTRCEKDGSFVLAVKHEAPREVRVLGGSSFGLGTLVTLRSSPPEEPGGAPGPLLCEVPPIVLVRIELEGVPTKIAIQGWPIHLETTYGIRKRIWPRGAHEGRALFNLSLPPGTYTLHRGVLIDLPPYEFVVPSEPDKKSMTLRVPARSAIR